MILCKPAARELEQLAMEAVQLGLGRLRQLRHGPVLLLQRKEIINQQFHKRAHIQHHSARNSYPHAHTHLIRVQNVR